MAMQGHYFIRDGEHIYESAAADKDFVAIQGANHGLSPWLRVLRSMAALTSVTLGLNMFNYIAIG